MRHRATEYRDTIASLTEHQFDNSEASSQYSPDRLSVSSLAQIHDGNNPSRPLSPTMPETPVPLQRTRPSPADLTPTRHELDIPYKQNNAKHSVPEPSRSNVAPVKSIHCVPTRDEYDRLDHAYHNDAENKAEYPHFDNSDNQFEYPHFDSPELWLQDVLQPATPQLFEPCTLRERVCNCSFCNLTRRVHGPDSSCAVRSPTSDGLGSANTTPRIGAGGSFDVPRPVTLVSGRTDGGHDNKRQSGRVKSWARGVVKSLTMNSEERRRARLKDSIVMLRSGVVDEGGRNQSI